MRGNQLQELDRAAGVFLDTLSALAYKTTKKTGERSAWLWQAGEAEEKSAHGL